jgi:PAS domain S-box-containing protein
MPSDSYSFLDVAVLDTVRRRFAAGDALVILSADLEEVLWANGPGAAVFGYADIEQIIGESSGLPPVARRQVMATSGFPDIGRDRALMVRLTSGMTSRAVSFLASSMAMPDGEKAILMAVPAEQAEGAGAADRAATAIGGFTEDGHFLAFIDGNGDIEAASEGFSSLGIAPSTLAALVAEVANERDRIVKRLVPAGKNSYPAGMARLTDEPARHLLVVIDEGQLGGAEPSAQASSPAPSPTAGTSAGAAGQGQADKHHHHDHWYFSSDDEAPVDAAAVTLPPPSATPGSTDMRATPSTGPEAVAQEDAARIEAATEEQPPKRAAAPVRFVWRTDAEGRFSTVSPEFAEAVGLPAADVVGRRFRDVATTFGLDPSGEVAGLLERRDTWSGRSVLWPLAGTDMKVPVDLAALPVYSRSREFEGFRGFGVARMADAVADPERIGLALVPNQPEPVAEPEKPESPPEAAVAEPFQGPDPFQGEVPALTIAPKPERRFTDKVIRLAEHRPPANDKGLSTLERSAFREIGERLKKDSGAEAAPPVPPPLSVPVSGAGEAEGTGKLAGPSSEASENRQAENQPAAPVVRGSLLDYAAEGPDGLTDDDSIAAADFRDAMNDGDLLRPAVPGPAAEPAGPARSESAQVPSGRLPLQAGSFLPSAFATGALDAPDISILAKLPVPLLIHSGDVLHYANDEFLDLAGYDTLDELDEAGGLDALFVEPYADDEAADEADRALRLRSRDGSEFPVEAILRSVPWQDRKALLLVVRRTGDIHSPAEVDATVSHVPASGSQQPDVSELKARIAEMRTIIDTATDGVVLIGRDGNIRTISRPAEALFGFDSDEVNGKPFASLFAIESQRAARDYLAGLTEHGVASVLNDGREVIGREAQGRFIPLFMTIGRLPGDSGYCAVVRDITQWKRAEEDLTQARAVAERASSQKTDFLARISHEIRTPLNAIIGFSELMVDEKFGPVANDRYRDYLRDINRSGNHVLDLVNDLLDISKIEAGQQDMDYEAVSLNDTLAETVALMQPQANRERVIIRSSFASRLPEVVADLRSVRQIALNILSNAIRYTQAGGQVIVSTAYEISGDVVLRVRDTGIGMTQAEIEQALKPFKQINALKRGRGDGTGLGLPLTKAMVEANRARFTINSTPGEGTLVEIAFPSTRVLAE